MHTKVYDVTLLQVATQYTSNMAAATILDRMTSLSFRVLHDIK